MYCLCIINCYTLYIINKNINKYVSINLPIDYSINIIFSKTTF